MVKTRQSVNRKRAASPQNHFPDTLLESGSGGGKQRWSCGVPRRSCPIEHGLESWNDSSAVAAERLLSGMDFLLRRANQRLTAESGGIRRARG
jgi:hypothetical protein